MSKEQGSNTSSPKQSSQVNARWWLPLTMLFVGIIIGSGATRGVDFFTNRLGDQPVSSNTSLPNNLNYRSVEDVYDELRKQYDGDLTLDQIMNGIKRGLVESAGDPYTTFFTSEENQEFTAEVNGTFTGIGAQLIEENNVVTIETPLAGYPAEKAGVKARDVILKIDEEDATGFTVSEAVKKIRGDAGTNVKLTLLRGNEQLVFTITREVISIPSLTYKITPDNIGVMTIVRFGDDTSKLATEAAQEFKAKNVKGVVVDLRNNPGGYLNQAVEVSSLWLKEDTVVVEERRDGKTERIDRAKGNPILLAVPTRVIINGGSASASEILAGALKDNGAARLIGEKSFGKGSVQEVDAFSDGSALKVTIARWFTPNGININKEGIQPDVVIELSEDNTKNGVDPQVDAALSEIKSQ